MTYAAWAVIAFCILIVVAGCGRPQPPGGDLWKVVQYDAR